MRHLKYSWIVLTAALMASTPALAQTSTPAAPPAKDAKSSDSTTITVFAQPRNGNDLQGGHYSQDVIAHPRDRGAVLLDLTTASSCAFMGGIGVQAYSDSRQAGVRITGPVNNAYNDAQNFALGRDMSRPGFSAPERGETTCGASDAQFAAARGDIYLHDKTFKEAFAAFDARDYDRALPLFELAYKKLGAPAAALMAGKMYLFGLGTPRDSAQAVVWLKKVANGRYTSPPYAQIPSDLEAMNTQVDAAMTLASIYYLGSGVAKDPREARKWLMRADELDYYPAAHILGQVYETGYGGERNMAKAVAYYKKAGLVGYAKSQYALGQIYYLGDDGIPQDKTLAGAWLLKAAANGYPDALYAVGRMYELGEGGAEVDPAKALLYYKEAAVKGQPDAQFVIATDFYLGNGVPRDLTAARQWFLTASQNGNPDAMFNLAVMMVNGEGGPKDLVKAYCWFYIAQKGGNDRATAALAELAPKMTADERAQADALLNPPPAK